MNASIHQRLAALEDRLGWQSQRPTRDERAGFYAELLKRRAVPLPPLDDVDIGATATLWAGDDGGVGRHDVFVRLDGARVAGAALGAGDKRSVHEQQRDWGFPRAAIALNGVPPVSGAC
jgi:hypothetical protein